jgi:hypothetical protein
MYKIHHPKADILVDRLHVTREEGGRSPLQIKAIYKAKIINIAEYLKTKYIEDQFVKIVESYEGNQLNMNQQLKWQQRLQKN